MGIRAPSRGCPRPGETTGVDAVTSIERRDIADARQALGQLGTIALSGNSLRSVLQTVSDLCTQVLPGGTSASVTLLARTGAATVVHTGRLALDLDESQYEHGDGPCLHAAASGDVVEIVDARTDTRWARYMPSAVRASALSSLSIPLGSPEQMAASLNVYAHEPGAFDDDSRGAATEFARFAGVAVANMRAYQSARELADNLQTALESRAVIDQAKGILIERHHLTAEQAFQHLVQASSRSNRKLREVADRLVQTGELAAPPRGPRRVGPDRSARSRSRAEGT